MGALAFLLTSAAAVEAVPVSLPVNAQIGMIGQTTVVPISIGSVSNVESIAVSITFNEAMADVLTTGDVSRVGTLTAACESAVINITDPGRLTVTTACFGSPVSGSGALFNVTFTGTGNGSTPLTFSTLIVMGEVRIPNGCLLNEGSPTCEPMNGQLTVGGVAPTGTATRTATPTRTGTRTNTPTRTATNTVVPPVTGTATNTPVSTATGTNTIVPATATSSATVTVTPTVTDTPTIGPSPTASNTTTPADTPTITSTPVNTGTVTDTPTPEPTATITATGTITFTGTVTRTRPGIPVVPSPASPAGAAMIAGLGAALLWALRRLYKSH